MELSDLCPVTALNASSFYIGIRQNRNRRRLNAVVCEIGNYSSSFRHGFKKIAERVYFDGGIIIPNVVVLHVKLCTNFPWPLKYSVKI